jgi:hypothetical protein
MSDDLLEAVRNYLRHFSRGDHIDPIQVAAELAEHYGKTENEVRDLIRQEASVKGISTTLQ